MPAATTQLAPPSASVQAAVLTAQLFPLLANPLLPATIGAPGKLTLEQKRFRIRASGKATTIGATTTAQAVIYGANVMPAANPLLAASWKVLGQSTARVINAATALWWIELDLIFDSFSGNLQGTFAAMVNSTMDASAPLINFLNNINGSNLPVIQGGSTIGPQDPVAVFAAGLTFGVAANAGNVGALATLSLEN